eukprot:2452201-Rhodomonas_salina.1
MPEHVVNFLWMVAEEVRETMASLGSVNCFVLRQLSFFVLRQLALYCVDFLCTASTVLRRLSVS